MSRPNLSIVIIEYHCVDLVEICIASIQAHLDELSIESIVVSNSEYDASALEVMRQRLPAIKVIGNDRNRGYAGGVNRALPECAAPFIFILNPDCRLLDSNVSELISFMKDNPLVAAVGPKVVDEHGVVQPSCRRFPRPWTFLLVRSVFRKLPWASLERRRYLMEDFSHGEVRDADWLSGGALLIRKSCIDIAGAMDERFFLYMEDVDWCRRFWQSNFRVTYVPHSTVIHAGQHESLRGGLKALISRHTRFHFVSMTKYFWKHGLRSVAGAFYDQSRPRLENRQ